METQFRDMAAIAKTATEKGADSAKALSNFHGTLEKFTKLKSVTSPSSGLASNQLINCITTLMTTWTESAKTRSDLANVDSDGLYEILKDWAYYFKAAGEFASRFENLRIQVPFPTFFFYYRITNHAHSPCRPLVVVVRWNENGVGKSEKEDW
jgi:hypothetical protein